MVTMPSARPAPATRAGQVSTGTAHHEKMRPGALLSVGTGQLFRVSKDGTRIHVADGPKRNVIRFSDDSGTAPALPGWLIRALLSAFGTEPTWARARRMWLIHRDPRGQWYVALELRGSVQGTLRFPVLRGVPHGAPVNLTRAQECVDVSHRLWAQADVFEKEPSAPAVLTVQS